jgi:hypothetical protein
MGIVEGRGGFFFFFLIVFWGGAILLLSSALLHRRRKVGGEKRKKKLARVCNADWMLGCGAGFLFYLHTQVLKGQKKKKRGI